MLNFVQIQVVPIAICCPRLRNGIGYWTDLGYIGNVSNGLSIHPHKLRKVNRFHLRNATKLDRDHLCLDLN